jgi:hypothetical protein
MDVGITIETAVTFPAAKREVGMVASGDAVTGTLKMRHISAIASKAPGKYVSPEETPCR